jgi:hypothetical protein
LKNVQPEAMFMKQLSIVSMIDMPAVRRIGSHMMEYQGIALDASTAVVAKSATSVAVSKPRPNTMATGYICHSLLIARIHLPKSGTSARGC